METEETANVDKPNDQPMEPLPGTSTSNVEKTETGMAKKSLTPKVKKRKKIIRDHTAPRQPLTGYIRFMNDRREVVRSENPTLPFSEITKILAGEWMNLAGDEKQQYLDAAEQDKERYVQELNEYKKTDAYRIFTQNQANKKQKEESQDEDMAEKDSENTITGFDIPIFTEEFLDHNKTREAELRQLRKNNIDYEQQNAILQKHMENMQAAVDKLTAETQQQKANNEVLKKHLEAIRSSLAVAFSNLPLPGTKETATLENIDTYMNKLQSILVDPNNTNQQLVNTVREIISRLDFNE